jgi:iron complex outermembrane receptor protein
VVIPLTFDNLMRGETYGTEMWVNFNPAKSWRLSGSYSFLRMQLHRYAESRDTTSESAEGNNPQHQFQIHSYLKLPRNFELDASLYHVSRLASLQIPSYARLDLRLGWRLGEGIELSGGGQNLLNSQRREFGLSEMSVLTSQVKRSAYIKLSWQF